MGSQAFHAHGSTLEIYDGVNFIPIIELSVIGMNFTADEINTTSHMSLNAWREYVRGLKSAEVLLEGNLIIGSNAHGFNETYGLGYLFDTGTLSVLRIRFKDGDPLTFQAILPEYTWMNDVEDAIRFSGKFRVSGIVTEAELYVLLWAEEFDFELFESGAYVSAWFEPWDYDQGKTWVSQYIDTWEYIFPTETLEYIDTWNYVSLTAQSRYIEEWEPTTLTATSQYIETWES
jgi:predicted secreted protein